MPVTNGTTTSYGFDYEDRLTSIGSSVSYDYIGASTDRYSKTVSGTTTQFLYDGGNVDEELQGTSVTAEYGAYAQKQGSSVYWELQDGQPSTRQLLNSSQTVVASYITDAYGNSVSSSGSVTNPFRWNGGSGYYSDNESGLQKVGARYYDPSVGRWISQDALVIAGSPADSQALDRFTYCEASPVGAVDANGHIGIFERLKRQIWNWANGKDINEGLYPPGSDDPPFDPDKTLMQGNNRKILWQEGDPAPEDGGTDTGTQLAWGGIAIGTGYLLGEGIKWGLAVAFAPETGGLSLGAAAALP